MLLAWFEFLLTIWCILCSFFSLVHAFAHGRDNYHFEEVQLDGHAHFAILTEPHDASAELFYLYMIGDRTGTVHLGANQVCAIISRYPMDMPKKNARTEIVCKNLWNVLKIQLHTILL